MIAEIDTRAYDAEGVTTALPKQRSLHFHPTFAMGTYLTCPGSVVCASIQEIRAFLRTCRYVSDPEQFGVRDYWMHPEDFAQRRRGDCDDFALWTWCALVRLGLDARFVVGEAGYGRRGHAWVTYREGERTFLLEPLAAKRYRLTRLSALFYHPRVSVSWDGRRLRYWKHEDRRHTPSYWETAVLAAEWIPQFMWSSLIRFLKFPWRVWQNVSGRGCA